MSEDGDYTPSAWSVGTSFRQARRTYDQHAGRSLSRARSENKTARDLVVPKLTTKAPQSLFIALDHTGSMGSRAGLICGKMGYLEHELRTEYFGKNYEVGICAVGDHQDSYPCEVRDLARTGPEINAKLKELVIEGHGCGNQIEAYGLTALYLARNVRLTKAVKKPIAIFIGDECCCPEITPELASMAHIDLRQTISNEQAFEELKAKFSVWFIHLPYCTSYVPKEGESWCGVSNSVASQWRGLLGAHRVVPMPDPERVVDVIYMILGEETGRRDYSEQELRQRQGEDSDGDYKIATVLRAMQKASKTPVDQANTDPDDDGDGSASSGKSTYHGQKPKRRAKRLLD